MCFHEKYLIFFHSYMSDKSSIYQSLRTALNQWSELPDEQWKDLASIFRVKTAAENDFILMPGDRNYELIFVNKGLLRIYYINEDGEESNKAFPDKGMFAGPLATALLGMPSRYGIQALEPTTMLATNYEDYFEILDRDPVFDRLGRKILEWVLGQRELREQSLLQQSAKERYLDFIEKHPDLIQRIPQYHIASYLGITEVSLSRLRKKLVRNGN